LAIFRFNSVFIVLTETRGKSKVLLNVTTEGKYLIILLRIPTHPVQSMAVNYLFEDIQ
jgi:hypothetical protein